MSDTKDRLIQCFAGAFPDVPESELTHASVASLSSWDSLANITLITVIEQEFDIQLPDEELENFISFDLILDYLERVKASHAS